MRAFLKLITPFKLFLVTSLLLAGIGLVALTLLFTPDDALLTTEAKTQIFSVEFTPEDEIPAFLNEQGRILDDSLCPDGDAAFSITDPAEVPVRIDFMVAPSNGSVTAQINPASEGRFGVVYCGNNLIEISTPIGLAFDDFARDQGLVIVSSGTVTIGSVPSAANSPILLEGIVTATSSSFPFKSGRASEVSQIQLGDQIRLVDDPSDAAAQTHLLARYSAEGGYFEIAANTVKGGTAMVNRLGSLEGFEISRIPSVWARLEAQSEWALILVLIALGLHFLSTLHHYMETRKEEA